MSNGRYATEAMSQTSHDPYIIGYEQHHSYVKEQAVFSLFEG